MAGQKSLPTEETAQICEYSGGQRLKEIIFKTK